MSEIDLDAMNLSFDTLAGRMKAKRTHRVPLCERAMILSILDEARTLDALGDRAHALVYPSGP